MTKGDYHVHTTHCDGKSTAEDTVKRAIELGLETVGFSGHGYTPFDTRYSMSEGALEYRAEILSLCEKYKGRIKILCGVERDLYGAAALWAEYSIGSVHYMRIEDEYVAVDETPEILREAAKKYFGGDMLSLCEVYFEHVGRVAKELHPDIIGHFNLMSKFNEREKLFDEHTPRYIAAWKKAADKLIPYGVPFEINTGAISRGYASRPYPSEEQIKYIAGKGGGFIMSSDCHSAENLCFEFCKWRAWAESLGAEIKEKI